MNSLLFATNNPHKLEEIRQAIGALVRVNGLQEAGIHLDIAEPHGTLEANAQEKSSAIFALTGRSCFSEDSGLEVEALGGAPGVRSARYAGESKSDADNIARLLRELEGQPNRRARFRTVISLIWKGERHLFKGICPGRIATEPRGNEGFGYDPVFIPDGSDRSFAEMSMAEKNQYSHRRKAADQLMAFLRTSS